MNTFNLNGNTIIAKKFDFNLLCDLDDYGVSIQDAGKKPMSLVRAYVAICANCDLATAGNMIQEHMAKDSLDSVYDAMVKEIEESDFFRNLQQTTLPKKAPKTQAIKK